MYVHVCVHVHSAHVYMYVHVCVHVYTCILCKHLHSVYIYIHSPSFRELIQEALHLVRADGQIARITQTLPLGDALEDVSEVVHQLSERDGHSSFDFGRLWCWRVGLSVLCLV